MKFLFILIFPLSLYGQIKPYNYGSYNYGSYNYGDKTINYEKKVTITTYSDSTIVYDYGSNGKIYSNPTLNINQFYTNRTATYLDFPQSDTNDSTGIHPDVIDFFNEIGKAWNGYRYWLIYTPLPQTNPNDHEVPTILVSNDLTTWINPPGGTNPITSHAECAYMADVDLFYDKSTKKLWAIYNDYPGDKIVGKYSTNGITWSSAVTILNNTGDQYYSASLIKVDNNYYIYASDKGGYPTDPTTVHMNRFTSSSMTGSFVLTDSISFDVSNCVLTNHNTRPTDYWYPWHCNMIKIKEWYLMQIYLRCNVSGYQHFQQMWISKSSDGINFTMAKYPLLQENRNGDVSPGGFPASYWDNGMYRFAITPTIADNKLAFNCIYSGCGGGYEIYPMYLGYALIKNFDVYNLGNSANSFNTTVYQVQLDSANNLNGNYVLGDDFSRIQTAGFGLGTSSSGYLYTYGASNYFKIDNGYAYVTQGNGSFFINLTANYEWQFDLEEPLSLLNQFYLKYVDATNYIYWDQNAYRLITRRGDVYTQYYSQCGNIKRWNVAEINRWKFIFNDSLCQIYVNNVLAFEHNYTVSEFTDQAEMNSFVNSTIIGMLVKSPSTKIYSMLLREF